jgi:hypothetical protein
VPLFKGQRIGSSSVREATMSDPRIREAIERTSAAISADPRTRVKIAGDADAGVLRALVAWGDAHSPVGCTVRHAAPCSLHVEVL